MKYSYNDLYKCAITNEMLIKWFFECYKEKDGDIWDKDNVYLEVKINGKELNNPLRYFEKVEDYLNKKIENHCKILDDFETEINKIVETRVNVLFDEKVYDLKEKNFKVIRL